MPSPRLDAGGPTPGVALGGRQRGRWRQRLADAGLEVEVEGAFAHEDLDRLHDGVNVALALYDPIRGNITDDALPVRMFEAAVRGVPSVVNAGALMGDIATSGASALPVRGTMQMRWPPSTKHEP